MFFTNKKYTSALLCAAMASMYLSVSLPVYAEEFSSEENSYEYNYETTSNLTVNGQSSITIRPEDDFSIKTKVSIPASEYKKIIMDTIKTMEGYKSTDPKVTIENRQVSGISSLKGKLEYQINVDRALVKNPSNPYVRFKESGGHSDAITKLDTSWVDNAKGTGIKLTFSIDWGKLIGPRDVYNLDHFESSSFVFPDLELDVTVPDLEFATNPDVKTTIKIESPSVIYSMESSDQGLVLNYCEVTLPTNSSYNQYINKTSDPKVIHESVTKVQNARASINIDRYRSPNNGSGSTQTKPSTPSQDTDHSEVAVMLRLYNPATGEHLFTTNAVERTHLVDIGWKNEYCEWNTLSTSDSPIYRLCNPNNDDHHYTSNPAEKNMLVQLGWRYEGISFYSATEDEGIPVYRMYNPNTTGVGSHHYTSSKAECDALSSYGWNFEGVAWYGTKK